MGAVQVGKGCFSVSRALQKFGVPTISRASTHLVCARWLSSLRYLICGRHDTWVGKNPGGSDPPFIRIKSGIPESLVIQEYGQNRTIDLQKGIFAQILHFRKTAEYSVFPQKIKIQQNTEQNTAEYSG